MGGRSIREKEIEIGGAKLNETAYGWTDLVGSFGKPPRRVVVAEYDPAWPAVFESLRQRVAGALDNLAAKIEHVGSTSVPRLAAKPIIDIDVLLKHASISTTRSHVWPPLDTTTKAIEESPADTHSARNSRRRHTIFMSARQIARSFAGTSRFETFFALIRRKPRFTAT